jgi:hypothetical protein
MVPFEQTGGSMRRTVFILFLSFLVMGLSSLGEIRAQGDFDPATIEAILKTQALLNTKIEREAFIKKSPAGKTADQQAKSFATSDAVTEDIYQLTASVFAELVKTTHGDPTKMMELLDQGQKNPEEFTKLFTPEQLKQLHGIAEKVEQAHPRN